MAVSLEKNNNIATVVFDHPEAKVNVLGGEVLLALSDIIDQVAGDASLKAVLFISRKKDVFIAGADIKEIQNIADPEEGAEKAKVGQDVFNKIEDLKIPTIAVIDGVALGGGCELILACQYRLATFNPKVRIGLPEVNLGIMPGFGGTYRMPRLIGLPEALKLILSGKPVDSTKALKIGLVDRLVPHAGLPSSIEEFCTDVLNGKMSPNKYNRRRKKKGVMGFLESNRLGHNVVFKESRKNVLKLSKGFYPAPLKALDAIKKNLYTDRTKGMEIERKAFGFLSITEISKNLIHLFYVSEKYRKLSLEDRNIPIKEIRKCGVLGAGIMGGGIAQLLSSHDIWVRLKDINHEAVAKGYQAAGKVYGQAVQKRRLTKAQAASKMAKITGALDYSGFNNADLIIEAVVEKMEVKKKVFKELSDIAAPDAILATNTSALSVEEMAKDVKDPSRVVGFHFFNPVHRMPLVEVITTSQTSQETIATALHLAKSLRKTPILVKDSCGFLVNRILLGYINEAGRLLEETGELEEIDKIMVDFGMPMGPFTLSDEVGLDVGIKVMHILNDAFGRHFQPTGIFEKVYEKGLLGRKSGKGFYIHSKRREVNSEVLNLVKVRKPVSAQDCCDRLILPMINEAALCLEEGIVDEAAAVDVGMIFGTGFPPFRGGLLKYADHVGIPVVIDTLNELCEKYKTDRFKPCPYLLKLQEQKKGFFD